MATILASICDGVEATSAPNPALAVRWQEAMKLAFRSGRELLRALKLPESVASELAEQDFPVFVPREFVARMRPNDLNDPLLKQVLAVETERSGQQPAVACIDPVGDLESARSPGLLQKYHGRALLITSGVCAIHCRYCFRRHYPYDTTPKGPQGWQLALQTIGNDPSIEEVILSGGDPLTVTDTQLQWLVSELNEYRQVQRIRIHSRVPVVIPQRVCAEMLEWVRSSRAAIYVVLHINHSQEIDSAVRTAVKSMLSAGATVLNQAVLLRGINDSPTVQLELCRKLINMQVLPYYLHQLDRVQGGMHFETPEEIGHQIIKELRSHLPGYAVPQYVREIAGQTSKTALIPVISR
jgi:EF-P beta-lysylation protein EpmB